MGESESAAAPPVPAGLFARNATGLVRAVSPRSAYILNFIPGAPVQALGYGLFFAFALFPGGNFFVAGLLALPLTLAYAYSFGLLTSMIPRTGGDYVLVGRVLNPWLGLISSFCMTVANVLSVAFFGVVVLQLGLAPGLVGLGLIGNHPTIVHWGATVGSSLGWKWAIGTGLFVAGALIMAWGWRWTARLQAILLGIVMLSLFVGALVALFTTHGDFVSNFNHFAQPYTHNPDTYNTMLAKATKSGLNIHPAFSFLNTIPVIGIFASFGIYSYFSTFVGGELRFARTSKTANTMAVAGVSAIVVILIFAAIFLRTFGSAFMTAANGGAMPAQIGATPTYFFLIAASAGSTVLGVFLLIGYMLFFPLITYMAFLQPVRMIFAYAFDGILPKAFTNLSKKTRSPYIALIATVVLTEAVFAWAVNSSSIFVVVVYAVLIQLIAMALVGLAAVLVPWRRPELYRAGSTTRTLARIPVVTIAGAGSILAAIFIWVLYFHYAGFGLAVKSHFFVWVGATIGAAVIYYLVVKEVRRRQGVDLARVYAEIPPE